MTASRPDSGEPTAQEELGGIQPEFTPEYIEAIGEDALKMINPALAAQRAAERARREYYEREFGLTGDKTDMDDDTREAMHRTGQGLREGTLPGMPNDPDRPMEPKLTPEEEGQELVRKAHEAWPEL